MRNPSEPNQSRTAKPADELISSLCATIPDYPKPGISFKDLTPVFADGAALRPWSTPWSTRWKASSTPSPGWKPAASCWPGCLRHRRRRGQGPEGRQLPRDVVSEDYRWIRHRHPRDSNQSPPAARADPR